MEKRILLTGASRGLGLALGQAFATKGHEVEGCSRSGVVGNEAGFPISRVDISDRLAVNSWSRLLIDGGFVPDILITNAGLINEPAPLWKVDPGEIDAIIKTNVLGTTNTLQAFLPAMIARGSGLIVTVSSGWGRVTDPDFAPYCASKFAVEGLTLSLAQELPDGLATISLSPGIVQTDMLVRCWGERAYDYELPRPWSERAVEFLLGISRTDNGGQFVVPAPQR